MITRVASMLTPLLLRDNLARSIRDHEAWQIAIDRGPIMSDQLYVAQKSIVRCLLHFSEGNLHDFVRKERQTR